MTELPRGEQDEAMNWLKLEGPRCVIRFLGTAHSERLERGQSFWVYSGWTNLFNPVDPVTLLISLEGKNIAKIQKSLKKN